MGLEHPQILISTGGVLDPIPCRYQGTTVFTIFNSGVTFIIPFDQKREIGHKYWKWKVV